MNSFVEMAFRMAESVNAFREQARAYFYEVMLSGHACARCAGPIRMAGEGRCICRACDAAMDPTLAFQHCSDCGGPPRLRVRRYVCGDCGQVIRSRFLFDGLVFDAEYFRQKMAEHRARRQELRERVSEMLAGKRSGTIELGPVEAADQAELHAGLFEALNAMTLEAYSAAIPELRDRFDLPRYQAHIQAQLQAIPINLNQIPPLSENTRLDRVWRFIAVIFLAHAGLANVRQEGDTILVMQHETDREGQAVPGDLEDADGIEGPVGRAAAW